MKHLTGTIQSLTVDRIIDTGYVLTFETNEVLLHHQEADQELQPNQEVSVFLYLDKKGKTVATTKLPHVQMDVYGWSIVKQISPNLSMFVDIGTTKEILVSKDNLPL